MKITKEQVLENLSEVKKFIEEAETKAEEKVVGLAIKNRWNGNIIFQSTKTTYKEAVAERLLRGANLCDADLRGANLRGANLRGADLGGADFSDAEMQNVKFYGRGGMKPLKRSQLPNFLAALGFVIED